MKYQQFAEIIDSQVQHGLRADLINKLTECPNKYTGLFVPVKPRAKIIQLISEIRERKFNRLLTGLIESYIKEAGFAFIDKQLFTDGAKVYLLEQRIRDDHNSSQKYIHINNFGYKVSAAKSKYSDKELVGLFYFIDDSFSKHKNFYAKEILIIAGKHDIELHLMYGAELFGMLNINSSWQELLTHIDTWRETSAKLSSTNFDDGARSSFNEIKQLPFKELMKLFDTPDLDQVLIELFPQAETLELLQQWFQDEYKRSTNKKRRKELEKLIELSAATIQRIKNK